MAEYVVLVDREDKEIGTEEKIKAHVDGKLHRAFSIFIFNSKNEPLLQRRALSKYHCRGLWTNTCCSHPRHGELLEKAVHRRLMEEMGFDCELKEIFSFSYKAKFDNGLRENEIDHVFIGRCDAKPEINREEVEEFKWIKIKDLEKDISENPEKYTPWFKIAIQQVTQHI